MLLGVRKRDPEALAAFFEHYFDSMYGLAVRLLGDRTQAEDVIQEVFLRIHRSAERIDVDRDPLPWLRTITANLCRDHWRSAKAKAAKQSISIDARPELGAKLATDGESPEEQALTSERELMVQQAIDKLPEQLRMVVVLRDYEGLEHEEIAGIVGANATAVRKRYSRALARLAELLRNVLT
jgi:RNA polymerase sigma-70 factor (ECF subfamily)